MNRVEAELEAEEKGRGVDDERRDGAVKEGWYEK